MKHSTSASGMRGLLCSALAFLWVILPLTVYAADAAYTDRIIVKYRTAAANEVAETARLRGTELPAARMGLAMRRLRTTALGSQVLKADRTLSLAEAERLAADIEAADPNVEYAEPDFIMRAVFTPNDTRYNEQWHYLWSDGGINAPAAWDRASGSGVVVAVLDTGYRPHVELNGAILAGYDFISDTFTANDGNGRDSDARDPGDWLDVGACRPPLFPPAFEPSTWHGTHVAGIIAARTNNARGVAGVAFNARVVPVRVLGKCGGFTSDIAEGVVWAAGVPIPGIPGNANPAKVINLSLGHVGSCSTTMQSAINSARSLGASVIAAAGNENIDASDFTPANCNGVVAVGSVNRAGAKSSFSNFGTVVELSAPGGDDPTATANDILSTLNAGLTTPGADSYVFYHGTSMAAPHVSGVVALMLSLKPALKPDEVTFLLQSTSRHFPVTCFVRCGAGIVNARAAVDAATGSPPGIGEVGPNDSIATAQPVPNANTIVNAAIGSSSDSDYVRVSLPGGRRMFVTLVPNPTSDYDLQVYDSAGTLLSVSRQGTGVVDNLTVTNTGGAAATYYARVVYFSGGTGATNGKYALRLNW
jgi:serine protease